MSTLSTRIVIARASIALLGALAGIGAIAAPASGNGGAANADNASSQHKVPNPNLATPVIPPLLIIAPTEVRTDPTLAKGCWIRMFAQPNFKGDNDITIAGPIALPSLHTPEGVDWHKRAESILVGPKAVLTVYENKDYSDKTATIKPGTQIMHLRKELRFTQSIDSLKIACEK